MTRQNIGFINGFGISTHKSKKTPHIYHSSSDDDDDEQDDDDLDFRALLDFLDLCILFLFGFFARESSFFRFCADADAMCP